MNPSLGIETKRVEPSLKLIINKIFLTIQRSRYMPRVLRIKILKMVGVKIGNNCNIADNITLDGIHPEWIEIGNDVHITSGVKILTHFFRPDDFTHDYGKITIANHAFIGLNSLIVNRVQIGEGAVLAAGSVVTKDIPDYEIWGGNPAKFIRKRKKMFKNESSSNNN